MDLNAIYADIDMSREKRPPDIEGILIPGKAGPLCAFLYTAAGEGPHPVVIFAHGFPGHEKNTDIGQALRRVGFSVLMFSYRGCWGSGGTYSFAGSLEDAESVLDFVLQDDCGRFDTEELFIVGHSVGAFVAAQLMARRKELRAGVLISPCDIGAGFELLRDHPAMRDDFFDELTEGAKWLSGTSTERLVEELEANSGQMRFSAVQDQLIGRPLLFISGEKDHVAPEDVHSRPMLEYLRQNDSSGKQVQWCRFPSDHFLSDVRIKLSEETGTFLMKHLRLDETFPELTEASFQQYIANSYWNTDLSAAAEHFHVSSAHLCRKLRRDLHTTFHTSLEQARMRRAAELLRETSKNLYEIAEEIGYDDAAYFMKVFKRCYGTTPSQYRKTGEDSSEA